MFSMPCGTGATPTAMAARVVQKMPMIMAPFTLWAMSTAVRMSPKQVSRGSGFSMCPRVTKVALSATTIPAFFMPMKAMNMPMPTTMALLSARGTASMSICRIFVTVSRKKTTPDMKTAPRATVQCRPTVVHT